MSDPTGDEYIAQQTKMKPAAMVVMTTCLLFTTENECLTL